MCVWGGGSVLLCGHLPESESESARYSIHLIMSITWSACGNGRKKNDKKKKKKKKKKDW